jgi:hypothetical protein
VSLIFVLRHPTPRHLTLPRLFVQKQAAEQGFLKGPLPHFTKNEWGRAPGEAQE